MQDALVRVADIAFTPKKKQFIIISNRFAWDAQPQNQRRRAALHFENVTNARRRGFRQDAPEVILSLLSLSFHETNAPSGTVTMNFSAGHSIQLDVEYLDCALRDLGSAWAAGQKPDHPE
jgi:hypothetical protein